MSKHKKQLKSYKFYFQQVNQQCVEEKAFSALGAFNKAEKNWIRQHKYPILMSAEVLKSGVWKSLKDE